VVHRTTASNADGPVDTGRPGKTPHTQARRENALTDSQAEYAGSIPVIRSNVMSRDIEDGLNPHLGFGPSGFSGSFGSAGGSSGAVVAALGDDGECADDFTGGGVDDADVEVVDEHDDAGSVEGSSESDVVHLAVDAETDASGLDAVAADPEFGVDVGVPWFGFGARRVRDGGCGSVVE
jgi:hypothetical protein